MPTIATQCRSRIDADSAAAYLCTQGVIPADGAVHVEQLPGRPSTVVLRVRWEGGCIVLKQWSAGSCATDDREGLAPARLAIERSCLVALARLLPGDAPRVVFSDDARCVLGIACAPCGSVDWGDALARAGGGGEHARQAATLLARLQRRSATERLLARAFDDRTPFVRERVEPCRRDLAGLHHDLPRRVDAELRRMLGTRRTLVHGDFAPTSLIADRDRMLLLGCDVAHWGDPAVDPAFLLADLILRSRIRGSLSERLLDNAYDFWLAFRAAAGSDGPADAAVVGQLGCLLLTGANGQFPVGQLVDHRERDQLRRFACDVLLRPPAAVAELLDRARRLG